MPQPAILVLAASLSTGTPQQLIDHLFQAFNRHDVPALQALYVPTARLTSSDFCNPRTGADVTRTYEALFRAFPTIRDDVSTIVIDGDQAAVRFVASVTGPEGALRIPLMSYFRFKDGKIVEDDTLFDTKGQPCEN